MRATEHDQENLFAKKRLKLYFQKEINGRDNF